MTAGKRWAVAQILGRPLQIIEIAGRGVKEVFAGELRQMRLGLERTRVTVAVGVALLMYHPQPNTVTVTVEKTVTLPCPPAKSGSASTKGQQSPAISGSGNPVTYGQPPAKKE